MYASKYKIQVYQCQVGISYNRKCPANAFLVLLYIMYIKGHVLTPVNNPVPMLLFHHHPDVCVSSPQAPHSCLYTHVEYHMCAYSKFFWFVSAVYLHENEKQSSSMSRNFAWKIQGLKQKHFFNKLVIALFFYCYRYDLPLRCLPLVSRIGMYM